MADDASTKREALKVLERYVANHAEMMYYPRHLAYGYEIGSEPTGALCKTSTPKLKGAAANGRTHRTEMP